MSAPLARAAISILAELYDLKLRPGGRAALPDPITLRRLPAASRLHHRAPGGEVETRRPAPV